MKKYLVLFFIISYLFLSAVSSVQSKTCSYPGGNVTVDDDELCLELDYPEFVGIDLNVNQNLNEMIAWFYYFIVGISGLASFIMLVWGGFQWLTSIGSPTKISDAKDKISSAILGLIIVLASFLILKVINPDFITLKLP